MGASASVKQMPAVTDTPKKPRIRIAEAVESGVEGLLLFLVRYFRTGTNVIFAPRRGWRRLLSDRHAARPSFVLPLTYLSIGLFLLSLLGQIAGTLVFDWIWFIDEIAERVTEALTKEISLIKVAVQALPGVLVIAAFGGVLGLTLRRRAPVSRRLAPFILSYAFGAQAFMLFAVAFGFVLVSSVVGKWQPPGGELGGTVMAALTYTVLLGGLLATFLGPLAFAFNALRFRRLWRSSRWNGFGATVLLSAAFFTLHLAVLYAMTLPGVVIERAKGPATPELTVGKGTYRIEGEAVRIRFTITLKNRGTKALGWETQQFELGLYLPKSGAETTDCGGDALQFNAFKVRDGAGREIGFTTIEPGHTEWYEVTSIRRLEARGRTLFDKPRDWGMRAKLKALENEASVDCVFRMMTQD